MDRLEMFSFERAGKQLKYYCSVNVDLFFAISCFSTIAIVKSGLSFNIDTVEEYKVFI